MEPPSGDRIVDEKLALVGLDRLGRDKFAHELSGGMQQRVGLARAFATDADILLMDEPFSALDPLIRDKLQDELLDLQRTLKKTIVFVSHDLDEALKLGNRIAILEGGRIVQCGTAEDILLRPGQRLRRRVRQAHEPAQRAPRHLGDDARLDAAPRGRTSSSSPTALVRVHLDADDHPVRGDAQRPRGRRSPPPTARSGAHPARPVRHDRGAGRSHAPRRDRARSARPTTRSCWSTSSAASPASAATTKSTAAS